MIIFISSIGFYLQSKEKKQLLLADFYIQAKIYLNDGKKNEAKNTLMKIINTNHDTYSALSLFLLINANLIENDEKLIELFDHVLNNNKFEKEIRNLIIFKKALIEANSVNEVELIKSLNQLINSETLWKPHALLLLGDYFFSKGEFNKARANYQKILSLSDIGSLHEQAKYRLEFGLYD